MLLRLGPAIREADRYLELIDRGRYCRGMVMTAVFIAIGTLLDACRSRFEH